MAPQRIDTPYFIWRGNSTTPLKFKIWKLKTSWGMFFKQFSLSIFILKKFTLILTLFQEALTLQSLAMSQLLKVLPTLKGMCILKTTSSIRLWREMNLFQILWTSLPLLPIKTSQWRTTFWMFMLEEKVNHNQLYLWTFSLWIQVVILWEEGRLY